MVSTHSVSFILPNFLYLLPSLLFPRSGGWVFLTLLWKFQLEIILVAGHNMAYLHCSNPENYWNNRFFVTQCRNEVSLHFWMTWWSCYQNLVKATSSTDFIFRGKMNNFSAWHIFMQYHSLIYCSILPLFLFFPVWNVARFVDSGYLDKKLIVLCHASLPSKKYWANVLSVVGKYSQFVLNISNHYWKLWVLFTAGLTWFLGVLYYAFSYYFLQTANISYGPDLLIGLIFWTISILGYLNSSSFLQIYNLSYIPGLLIGIICWTMLSSPGLIKCHLLLLHLAMDQVVAR